ncbi:MAG: hypothetical protein ACE5JV_02550 [Nitrososphaerales archaeon]
MMMKIALDVDGVLADIIHVWLEEYNKTNNRTLKKQEISQWDFWKGFGYDRYRFYEELSRCWSRWEEVPVMEQSIASSVEKLNSAGTVDIVTARDAASAEFVKQWLKHNEIMYSRYVPVMRGRDKADLSYDVFIDDSPLNAVSIASKGKRVLLYDQPWNRSVNHSKVVRIKRLEEAVDVISGLPGKFGKQYGMDGFLDV